MTANTPQPRPLYYTFANHMHWVDMQWLWGYHVLPGSVRDMLHLCRETGARGGVNFDAVGYEKLAAESPEALVELREAVAAGVVEPVGCSYGQPYGLFQPLESNIRQFTYGVRATQRLLGVRPATFWEEEFYFFPQLPQVLRQCGYTGACLFFQWTWHTPEIPKEPHSLIVWEGADGTGICALPRNDLNVHQWPEDFDGLLEGPLVGAREEGWGAPAIAQWLELMPSRDWMCRSEVLLPRLKELMGDERFEVRARTPGAVIAELAEQAGAGGAEGGLPRRRYAMDDVWHGMTLGKNADRHPRTSAEVERLILAAESLAATASLLGRPYPSWDVYPAWELDEAWRELLAAQHHDNHECEGLCGFVGYQQMEKARAMAREVLARTQGMLQDRCGALTRFNALGYEQRLPTVEQWDDETLHTRDVPPFGYSAVKTEVRPEAASVERTDDLVLLSRGALRMEVDTRLGQIRQIYSEQFPDGMLAEPFPGLRKQVSGQPWQPQAVEKVTVEDHGSMQIQFAADPAAADIIAGMHQWYCIDLLDGCDGVRITLGPGLFGRPDAGFAAALRTTIKPAFAVDQIAAEVAGAAEVVEGGGPARRKYPKGDWMTSSQWFEDVEGSIVAQRWLDVRRADGAGLLLIGEGARQYFRVAGGVDAVLSAYDPWDERRYDIDFDEISITLVPHGPMTDAQRNRAAVSAREAAAGTSGPYLEMRNDAPAVGGGGRPEDAPIPPVFGPLSVEGADGVLAEAFYRESMYSGERLPEWAGHRMFAESGGACDHPFVIRLVEYNGAPAEITLKLAGEVAMAAKTNLMGEVAGGRDYDPAAAGAEGSAGWSEADCGWLSVERDVEPPDWAVVDGKPIEINGAPLRWAQVRFRMRPREIATVMCDMVMGRKQWRDLDAKREVWATIHKAPGEQGPGGAAAAPTGAKNAAP